MLKPEKQVELDVHLWAIQNGWSLDTFECKAIKRGTNIVANPGLPVGTPDKVGSTVHGFAAFVELKRSRAAGKCRFSQYLFLMRKIESNAFCIVTDSSEHLSSVYQQWLSIRKDSLSQARKFLISKLPKKVLVKRGKSVVTMDAPL